ncbi:caspase family protein [Streptomyces sp. NPDC101227]|uniref:caspase, EACC1-associated type n=1 Tax=Streptomyces sp. NPDC101227 TaxID=3366136 RepID=UPI00381E9FF7
MRRSALILVNERHADKRFTDLPGASADAQHLSSVLRDPEIGQFEVTVESNKTARAWRKAIQRFFSDAERDDELLLHLSCHGRKDMRNRLHFVAKDTESNMLEATSVSAEFLADRLEESRSRRIILLLDCCYSGAFSKGMRSRGEPDADVSETFQGNGRIVITSSTSLQYSYESEVLSRRKGQPSIFTSAVVDGLRSGDADLDQDGFVSVEELYEFVSRKVTEQIPEQTPTLSAFSVEGQIFLARNPKAVSSQSDQLAGPDPRRAVQVTGAGRRGSGYQVTGDVVLTAAHVVSEATSVQVRFLTEEGSTRELPGDLVWENSDSDIALLKIADDPGMGGPPLAEVSPVRFGRITQPVECEALGFPRFTYPALPDAGAATAYRDAHHALGRCTPLSHMRTGSLEISVGYPPLYDPGSGRSPWEGMSGAAVWSGGCVIAVISEHHRADGLGQLVASRLDRWYGRLTPAQISELSELIGLPANADQLEQLPLPEGAPQRRRVRRWRTVFGA